MAPARFPLANLLITGVFSLIPFAYLTNPLEDDKGTSTQHDQIRTHDLFPQTQPSSDKWHHHLSAQPETKKAPHTQNIL